MITVAVAWYVVGTGACFGYYCQTYGYCTKTKCPEALLLGNKFSTISGKCEKYLSFVNIYCSIGLPDIETLLNSSVPEQNGCQFGRRHFQMHFSLNENDRIPIQSSLKFDPRSAIDNKAALVQVGLAPRRPQAIFWTNADLIHWCLPSNL